MVKVDSDIGLSMENVLESTLEWTLGEVIVDFGIGSHTPRFSLDSASINRFQNWISAAWQNGVPLRTWTQWQCDRKRVTFIIIFDRRYCLFFRSAVFSVNNTHNY